MTQLSLAAAEESIQALTGENADLSARLDAAGASIRQAQSLLESLGALMAPAE